MSTALHADALRDWHLALLLFAASRHEAERVAVLKIADKLDKMGVDRNDGSNFQFFRRTSVEVCNAIANESDPARSTVLRIHLARIEDSRIKRAFEGALGWWVAPRVNVAQLGLRRDALWAWLPTVRS